MRKFILTIPTLFIVSFIFAQNQFFYNVDSFNQINFISPIESNTSCVGELNFTFYNPSDNEYKYLNLFSFNPNDPSEFTWSVQNILLDPSEDIVEYSYWFDLKPLGCVYGEDFVMISAVIEITDTIRTNSIPLDPNLILEYPISPFNYNIGNNAPASESLTNFPTTNFPLPRGTQLPPQVWEGDSLRIINRRCNIPNIDLDHSANNPLEPDSLFPGYAGDFNACGPAATSNSFMWLGTQHPEIGSVMDSVFGTDSLAHRRMMVEFSELMGRENLGDDVTIRNFIEAKLAFIDKYKLPMHVKYQTISDGIDSVDSPNQDYNHSAENHSQEGDADRPWGKISRDWIYEEMARGEDVELFLLWVNYDEDGNLDGLLHGHYVTLSGIMQRGDQWRARIKDDNDQMNPNGTRNRVITLAEDTTEPLRGAIIIPELSADSTNGVCYIKDVVSESYDSTVTFEQPNSLINLLDLEDDVHVVVYPNPISNSQELILEINLESRQEFSIHLLDLNGKVIKVLEENLVLNSGREKLQYELKSNFLNSGIYFIQFISNDKQLVKKVVVH